MKSKTSFFNFTVVKKDFTRFLPLWLIYLIGGLLVCSSFLGSHFASVANGIASVLSYGMPIINCGYALLAALLLFGDLSNARLCNALHAMPLRRENWFLSHFCAGMLFSLLPNLVIALVLMPMLERMRYVSLLWVGASTLQYLFFFSLAVLCVMVTGSKFAAVTIYALLNFVSLELLWLWNSLILPFLNGVRISTDALYYLSPVVKMMGASYFHVRWNSFYDESYLSFDGGWGYLVLLALIGIALAVAALLLYRKRQLEVAGDFAAVRPVKWVLSIFGSLCCAMVFRLFGLDNKALGYLFLFVGAAVGFFLLQMLLQRKVRVLTKRTALQCLVLLASLGLVLIGSATDILGIESYIPNENQIDSIIVVDGYYSDVTLAYISEYPHTANYDYVLVESDFDTVLRAHKLAISEKSGNKQITLRYILKSGRTVTRSYRVTTDSPAYQVLLPVFTGAGPFYNDSVTDVRKGLDYLYFEGVDVYVEQAQTLLDLFIEDYNDGLTDGGRLHMTIYWTKENGAQRSRTFYLYEKSKCYAYLQSEVKQYYSDPWRIFGCDLDKMQILHLTTADETQLDADKFLDALRQDEGLIAQQEIFHADATEEPLTVVVTYFYDSAAEEMKFLVWNDMPALWALLHPSSSK